jgi:lactate dehydrogenase-like 2-hydroxyacid dehydrogenase
MKIAVLTPKSEFSPAQQERLARLGDIVYTRSREEYPLNELIKFCEDSAIIAFDPDNIGGFDVAPERLMKLMNCIPNLKGLALVTTSFGYVDLKYCKRRGITVTNVPYYATESVAEDVLAFLIGCAKRIFLTDRRTQRGEYKLELGFELRGKTLGVIGLGHIGTRVAELGLAIGMQVIGWNRSPKIVPGVEMKPLDDLLAEADAISLALVDNEETVGFLSRERITKLKEGVIVVNTASRTLVDEEAMAEALKSGRVDSYVQECDDVTSPPLGNLENAFLFKVFGWYTKEALERNFDIWIDNIEGILKGAPVNPV